MTKKVPITVVTGFLGVGKTTLLHNLLNNSKGKRIAVLVNEFGEVGVDGEVIESGCGDEDCDLVELANGCICCTVQEEFLPAMQELVERKDQIDHIVIETSGLALPKPLVRAVNWPDLKPHITVDSVITVVDAVGIATGEICDRERVQKQRLADENLDHETPIEELFYDQLTCADLVLVSKRDLVEDKRYEEIKETISGRLRPNTKILPVVNGEIESDILLGINAEAEEDLESRYSIHDAHHENEEDHEHDESIKSININLDWNISDINKLIDSMKQLVHNYEIYRIKGFVNIEGKPMRMLVQGVGDRFDHYFDRKWHENEERKTSFVVIGRNIEKAEIEEFFEKEKNLTLSNEQ